MTPVQRLCVKCFEGTFRELEEGEEGQTRERERVKIQK